MIDGKILNNSELFYETAKLLHGIHTGREEIYGYGIDAIDEVNPLMLGTLHLIGGKTASGKTRFIRRALHHMTQNTKALYLTMEDNPRNFGLKCYEDFGGVNFLEILHGAKREPRYRKANFAFFRDKLAEVEEDYRSENVGYMFFNSLDINEMDGLFQKYSEMFKIWIIDYIQATESKGSIFDRNSLVAKRLREASIKHNILVIGIAQLNRQVDNILSDRPPSLNDIQGAGTYEQGAHSVILLRREPKDMGTYYLPTDNIEIYLFKNRLGSVMRKFKLNKHYALIIEQEGQNNEKRKWNQRHDSRKECRQ